MQNKNANCSEKNNGEHVELFSVLNRAPVFVTIMSKPPGCSSRKCVTSYTLPLIAIQQSSSVVCSLRSFTVYSFVGLTGSVSAITSVGLCSQNSLKSPQCQHAHTHSVHKSTETLTLLTVTDCAGDDCRKTSSASHRQPPVNREGASPRMTNGAATGHSPSSSERRLSHTGASDSHACDPLHDLLAWLQWYKKPSKVCEPADACNMVCLSTSTDDHIYDAA